MFGCLLIFGNMIEVKLSTNVTELYVALIIVSYFQCLLDIFAYY